MLRLDKVIKPWKESAALNDHINLYGFWNDTAFLTKSGDLGMVLSVPGVDYESLDRSEQEYAVKRLEAAPKASLQARGRGIVDRPGAFSARRTCRRHPRVKCGHNFFNSLRCASYWFVSAGTSLKHSTSGIRPCRRAMTLNTVW
jgi:hypothetical protein